MKFSKLHSDLKIIEFKFLHLKTIVYYCIKNCPIFSSSTSLESPQAPLHFGMRVFTVVQIVEKLWANVQDMLSTPVNTVVYLWRVLHLQLIPSWFESIESNDTPIHIRLAIIT